MLPSFQLDRWMDGWIEIEMGMGFEMQLDMGMEMEMKIGIERDREIGRQTARQTETDTDRHRQRQTDTDRDRQTDGQTDTHTQTQTQTHTETETETLGVGRPWGWASLAENLGLVPPFLPPEWFLKIWAKPWVQKFSPCNDGSVIFCQNLSP